MPATGDPLPPNWALQLPSDWVQVLRKAVPAALSKSGIDPAAVVGLGTAFTACTVLPTTADGTPLCELEPFRAKPHAYPKLWKHHAAQPQADRINGVAEKRGETWLARYGGRISSEWEFAKALQVLEEDPGSTPPPSDGSRPLTGSSGSCAAFICAMLAPLGTKASIRTVVTRRGIT